jgi:hypothetical protein
MATESLDPSTQQQQMCLVGQILPHFNDTSFSKEIIKQEEGEEELQPKKIRYLACSRTLRLLGTKKKENK